jgi:hypothetical protein
MATIEMLKRDEKNMIAMLSKNLDHTLIRDLALIRAKIAVYSAICKEKLLGSQRQ